MLSALSALCKCVQAQACWMESFQMKDAVKVQGYYSVCCPCTEELGQQLS